MVSEKKINHVKLLTRSFASIIDQAILSLINLCIGLLLIRIVTKNDYGVYTQLIVVGLFVSVLLEAFITSPLTTIAPSLSSSEKQALYRNIYHLQRKCNLLLAILFALIVTVVIIKTQVATDPWLLGIIFGAFIFFNAQREFRRSILFVEQQALKVLALDSVYFILVTIGILCLYLFHQIETVWVFAVFFVANLISLFCFKYDFEQHKPTDTHYFKSTFNVLWKRAKWALPGAILAWLTNYSYLFISAALLGIAATAELNASKLLLMPIALGVLAWSRIAKPMASQLFYQKNWHQLRTMNIVSIIGIESLILLYVLLLWLCLPWLEIHLLGPEYQHITPFVLAWGGYFMINAIRFIGSSWLTSHDQYKALFVSSIVCMLIVVIGTYLFIPVFGAWGAILALIAVEFFDLLLIWCYFLPRAKKEAMQ